MSGFFDENGNPIDEISSIPSVPEQSVRKVEINIKDKTDENYVKVDEDGEISVKITEMPAVNISTGDITISNTVEITNDEGNPIPVEGTVNVGNFPTTQQVTIADESVTVVIDGTPSVTVDNFPTSFDVNVTNTPSSEVTVTNFPTEIAVNNQLTSIEVSNFPEPITEVTVSNFPTEISVSNPVTDVSVNNFPTSFDVTVSNPTTSVSVSNFPTSTTISGSVEITNDEGNAIPTNSALYIAGSGAVDAGNPLPVQLYGSNSINANVSNFPANQTISGDVSVSNFPANQTVTVDNFPETQTIYGEVNIGVVNNSVKVLNTYDTNGAPVPITVQGILNGQPIPVNVTFPATQTVHVDNPVTEVSVSNQPTSIEVSNFPENMLVTVDNPVGEVSVSNFPTTIEVSNQPTSIEVSNFPATPTEIAVNNFPANQTVTVSNPVDSVEVTSLPAIAITNTGFDANITNANLNVTVSNPQTSVSVSNFPSSVEISNDSGNAIPVSGTVTVANPVSSVEVSNFPANQSVTVTSIPEVEVKNDSGSPLSVQGSVSVTNFPTEMEIKNDINNPIPVQGSVNATVGGTVSSKIVSSLGQEATISSYNGQDALNVGVLGGNIFVNNTASNRVPTTTVVTQLPSVDINSLPEVEIKNDINNPVLVEGTVQVSNFPLSVEISNDSGNAIPITGTVNVNNFPSSVEISNDGGNPIPVSGSVTVSNPQTSVSVSNFPATQAVSGNISVSNFPATQPVSGSVSVSNLPATQAVSGSVSVSNFPATQPVSLSSVPTHAVTLDTSANTVKIDQTGTNNNVVISGTPSVNATIQNASIPVTGTFWQTTQPVSGSVSISGTPSVSLTGTNTVRIQDNSGNTNIPVSIQNASIPVTGTFFQATQPVSLASVPSHPVTLDTSSNTVKLSDTSGNGINSTTYTDNSFNTVRGINAVVAFDQNNNSVKINTLYNQVKVANNVGLVSPTNPLDVVSARSTTSNITVYCASVGTTANTNLSIIAGQAGKKIRVYSVHVTGQPPNTSGNVILRGVGTGTQDFFRTRQAATNVFDRWFSFGTDGLILSESGAGISVNTASTFGAGNLDITIVYEVV